ncbi:hypothetical protein KDA_71930 [Dictyobacter alpinus]|uniref:Glycoside hydrolase family 5 domain-containing protein n=1 Tax=Dictyobacter alpinus TaxID=2014873 RepID=A0A402BK33_9CHLR|nr:hypothetical protein [Dictyobacter alpinus]GCE31709.1 hypothetical protein KDA_71930 [Dictyobacter alpinus]
MQKRSSVFPLTIIALLFLILIIAIDLIYFTFKAAPGKVTSNFIASIDTMKVSRDTETRPLSQTEIKEIVQLAGQLNTNYITVDTHWDYPEYMQSWINAIHQAGQHVWFRGHPNQWENQNNANGTMTPAQYLDAERRFIQDHPTFFADGDIFDPCPEPEQGHYWENNYGHSWTSNAPNQVTREFNRFLRDATSVADAAFQQSQITGVTTTIRSINSFFATHTDVLERATIDKFGRITIDSYPELNTFQPEQATKARIDEIKNIYNLWHVPIILGEMGYSNQTNVDDATQQAVLKDEFAALQGLSYLDGVNYWVGPGSTTTGGYTYIIKKEQGHWSYRPAANDIAAFYQKKRNL